MKSPSASRWQDIAFFAAFLLYAWAGIDTRLIYHWQGPVFYSFPGFLNEFLKYPGGVADYLYGLTAQAYSSRAVGAIVLVIQVAAVSYLTQLYFITLGGHAQPILRFIPALLLLYHANLYYDHTPLVPALLLGLTAAVFFVYLLRRWRSESALLITFAAMLAAVYYLAGMAMVFLAPAAVILPIANRRRPPLWIIYLLLSAALPASVELLHLAYLPVSSRDWFARSDLRLLIVYWGLYLFYTVGTILAFRWASVGPALWAPGFSRRRMDAAPPLPADAKRKRGKQRPVARRWATMPAIVLPLLGLGCVAMISYRLSSRDRRLATLDYHTLSENWPEVIKAAQDPAFEDFNSLTGYEINLALHEMNRLGDDMFRFPQAGAPILEFQEKNTFLPYMIRITDMCLRLGRVNEAEHYGSEALVLGRLDPRIYSLLARVHMVKGQTAAAGKFLTVLSHDLCYGPWARQRIHELDQDPQRAHDPQIQVLRRRMLQKEDMFEVWQKGDKAGADMERLLWDQLEQDASNRMAFEFLMCAYLRARNLEAIRALMPRIKDMTGPAYVDPDGKRRTPRHYQEAMAVYSGMTGRAVHIEAFEIQSDTFQRLEEFRRITDQAPSKESAKLATWKDFRDTYFFYIAFGPGDYR